MKSVCLISGGSSGFGKSLAAEYLANGYRVILVARRKELLSAAVGELHQFADPSCVFEYSADVTESLEVLQLAGWVRSEFGRLDVLINAVGASDRGFAGKLSEETLDRLWRTNVVSAVNCTREFLSLLTESRGSIVNLGSLASKFGARWMGGYTLVKHALAGWTQQLRLELRDSGVHVMLVCPGPILRDQIQPRYVDSVSGLPASAMLPAGGAKLNGLDPQVLARKVYRAMVRRRAELVAPGRARLLMILIALWPQAGEALLMKMTGGKPAD